MVTRERLRELLKRVPHLRNAIRAGRELKSGAQLFIGAARPGSVPFLRLFPPGHFYSPVPDLDEVERFADTLYRPVTSLPGIDLAAERQLALLDDLAGFYPEMPFTSSRTSDLRFYFGNDHFEQADATVLYAMLRRLEPKRVIEIGCGFSSAVMLDTDELYLGSRTEFTFIDPYPERLLELQQPGDESRTTLLTMPVQDVPLERFATLERGDFLFIDSSHITRIGSDVNHLYFEVLPRLAPGVIVHIHDIFWPLEYPLPWVRRGQAWNEIYLFRAFLTCNSAFRIMLFNSYLGSCFPERVGRAMPNFLENCGGSIWLERLG